MLKMKIAMGLLIGLAVSSPGAFALPSGPQGVCDTFPEAADCIDGQPDCTLCHIVPPTRNVFGRELESVLLLGGEWPLLDASFAAALPDGLRAIADEDADGDGATNLDELLAGTAPADPLDSPDGQARCTESRNPRWNVCGFDAAFTFRKVFIDVCGKQPDYAAFKLFASASPEVQDSTLDEALRACLGSEFWIGKDGMLWRIAHPKVRPLQAIKSGADAGPVPLADYFDDYALFVFTQTGDRDARDLLTAEYYVTRRERPTRYTPIAEKGSQNTQLDRRAGMITTAWFHTINTMFTPVPRATAAQAYRAYLGLDIAKSQGLISPPDFELIDYDEKGVLADGCRGCHTTLDPLTYPFTRYHGIAGRYTAAWDGNRMNRFGDDVGERVSEVPEAGFLFGEPVADLREWAEVAANSDAFAQSTVRDYWRVFIGHEPSAAEQDEFDALWRAFRDPDGHNYRVESMLHALIRTEAYSVP